MSERGENSSKGSTGGVVGEYARVRSAVTRALYDVMQTLYAVRAEWCGDGYPEVGEALGEAISRVASLAPEYAPDAEAEPSAQGPADEVENLKSILRDLIAAYDASGSADLQLTAFDETTLVRRELSEAERLRLEHLRTVYIRTGIAIGDARRRAEDALKP